MTNRLKRAVSLPATTLGLAILLFACTTVEQIDVPDLYLEGDMSSNLPRGDYLPTNGGG